MNRLLSLKWVKRVWILFFLSVMVLSAIEIGIGSGGYVGRYVLAFFAAVVGTVATSIAVALNSPRANVKKPPAIATEPESKPNPEPGSSE